MFLWKSYAAVVPTTPSELGDRLVLVQRLIQFWSNQGFTKDFLGLNKIHVYSSTHHSPGLQVGWISQDFGFISLFLEVVAECSSVDNGPCRTFRYSNHCTRSNSFISEVDARREPRHHIPNHPVNSEGFGTFPGNPELANCSTGWRYKGNP